MGEQNEKIISKYQGEKNPNKKYLKLAKKITDVVPHHLFGLTSDDPEYWGLREVVTEDMVNVALTMKVRKFYSFEELLKMNRQYDPITLQKIIDDMSVVGIMEYDYGDNYNDDGPIKDAPKTKRYRLSYFVPGSAELFNSSIDRIEKNPAVASFFERMTFIPLEAVTSMVRPGGNGIGMHVIPVEKAIEMEKEAVNIEKISYWLKKYDGHISAGICSCRYSRSKLGDGCIDDPDDWCIQVGDMADYTVETGRAHYISKEEALEILQKAEDNGFVHQVTNIDGKSKIFDICNCDVKICNALRTSMLFNTPNMSRSSYTARVTPSKCVACGLCVESCPAGAVKLGQKLCKANGEGVKYPKAVLPDRIHWGKYAWDENYRDTARMYNSYQSGTAPCKVACPAHVPVQAYLKMAHEGKYEEALALIKKENPFPAVCGRVCNKKCEEACTRGLIDEAVSIDAVKKFVADLDISKKTRYIPKKVVASVHDEFNEKIAIIGAGPAGLSAAYYLATMGFKPTVFEKNEKPGGMLRYGIPNYKLEKDVIDAEIEVIKELGVEIKCGVEVGKDITIAELKEEGYKSFYLAIGCQGGRLPNVPNEEAEGTKIAVNYLKEVLGEAKPKQFKEDVIVIGGGNVAVDCARTAHRLGAKSVKMICLEDKDHMPASKEEIKEALEEGVEIIDSFGPKEVLVDENKKVRGIIVKRCTSTIDKDGKFNPQYNENEVEEFAAKQIIFAIGQKVVWGDLLKDTGVTTLNGNYPIADRFTYQTKDEDIFVGGDLYTGPRFVIDAIAQGHEAAESLARHARPMAHLTIGRDRRKFIPLDKEDLSYPSYDTAGRQEEAFDEKVDRLNSFKDGRLTLSEEQVKIETGRCLSCGASIVDENKCIGCGICTTRCKFDAIHLYRDHPEMSDMRRAEDKVTGLLSYALKRSFKIIGHSGSEEAKMMRKKRKDWKKATKEFRKTHKHTGNSVDA